MLFWPLSGPDHHERAWWYACNFPTAKQPRKRSEQRPSWTGLGRDEKRAATRTAARQGGG